MLTITISEATLNQTLAALAERVRRLDREITRLQRLIPLLPETHGPHDSIEDAQRALVWNIAALHETQMAREYFGETNVIDHPADATYATVS